MAKRGKNTRGGTGGARNSVSGATTADTIEQQVLAFAKQVGRIAGAMQAKAEGLMDRGTLKAQIARVRDGAAKLLEQFVGEEPAPAKKKPAAATARRVTKGRSGGVVDAPGKKHRKPLPSDPGASLADSQAAKLRAATPMAKTNRLRGRG